MAKKSTKRSKKPDEIKTVEPTVLVEELQVPPVQQGTPRADTESQSTGQPLNLGLTSLSDYYQEPTPEPERVLTPAQLESIREEAFTERFGAPVPDFRSAVVARLNDKLRS